MFEKLKEKLKEIFADKGIDEETQEEVLAEVDKVEEQPKPEDESQPEVLEENAVEAEQVEEMPKEEPEVALPEEAPAEPVVEEIPQELPQEMPQPSFDFEGLKADLDETKKTNDALLARIESLEEALRSAGVIEGEKPQKPYGVDKPSAPGKDPLDDGLDDFFRKANRKSF